MAQNFIESRREQGFLLPPDVRDWLGADHLAWFVIDAVAGMDLAAFYGAYRENGQGRAAYEPSLMVAVILFAFATGVRSSRAIERHCREHVAFRVITGNLVPDHVTVARFICRHGQALSELFTDVLSLCHRAGLVKPGWCRSMAPGSRVTPIGNLEFEPIAKEIVAQARATDEAEDKELGGARGDELPEEFRTVEGRREFLRRARQALRRTEDVERPERIEAPVAETETEDPESNEPETEEPESNEPETEEPESSEPESEPERTPTPEFEFDAERIVDAGGGRRAWLRDAQRQLEQHRWESPDPIGRSREERAVGGGAAGGRAVGRLRGQRGV